MSYCFNPNCLKLKNPTEAKFCLSCNASLLLKDRYRGLEIIGQGGRGRTLLAVDRHNPKEELYCIIKQLYPKNNSGDSSTVNLFKTEVDTLNKLGQHPQIPQLYDYFELDKYQYLVQEWIEGNNLRQSIAKKGLFSDRAIIQLLANLLPVLAYIHIKREL